ncbi:MAG: nucleoside triphosphate pyrophosphohydrolase [Spirochaetales bacterium]
MRTPEQSFYRLYTIMQTLRGPNGCPWDREQTPKSIRGNLIEEAYECVEAITQEDTPHIREELGDVFLVATFMAYMYEQEGRFTLKEVLDELCDKLVRRHPHVFSTGSEADTPDKVVAQWKDIKVTVEGKKPKDSLVDDVPHSLPPLDRAYKIQKKVATVGFDWERIEEVWKKVKEEVAEAEQSWKEGDTEKLEEEVGDLLFSLVNVSRFLQIDPSVALSRTLTKFSRRFKEMERRLKSLGLKPGADQFALMDKLWEEIKNEETVKD